jgi:hypothetical protein
MAPILVVGRISASQPRMACPHRRGVVEIHSDRLRAEATHEIGACHAAGSGPYGMTRRHERLEGRASHDTAAGRRRSSTS